MSTVVTSSRQVTADACTAPEEWDAFVRESDGPPFALWGWGTAAESYGHDRHYLVARDGEGAPVAALPLVHVRSRLFGDTLVSPPYGERGGVISGRDAPEEAPRVLLERARGLADDLAVDFVSLRGVTTEEYPGFEERTRFVTFRVPLGDGPDAVYEGIKDSRERQIRAAGDEPLTYRAGDSVEDLRAYFRLYLRAMRGHGTPPHSFAFLRTIRDALAAVDGFHVGLLETDDRVVNGILDLSLGSTVYQWGVINDYDYRDLNGGSLLLWKSLERAAREGYGTYEFGRTREGSGVYLFKKSFGGEKTWYRDRHYFPGDDEELPHPEKEGYEPLKRVWRRLPIPVTRLVGPRVRKSISL